MKQRLRSMPHKKVGSNLVHPFVDISFMYKIGTMLSFDLRTCQLVSLCGPKIWSCASSHLHCIWKIWKFWKKILYFGWWKFVHAYIFLIDTWNCVTTCMSTLLWVCKISGIFHSQTEEEAGNASYLSTRDVPAARPQRWFSLHLKFTRAC